MNRVNLVADACHFVSGIRTAFGKHNFWMRADEIEQATRNEALWKATRLVNCVSWDARAEEVPMYVLRWTITSAGFVPVSRAGPPTIMPEPKLTPKLSHPTARSENTRPGWADPSWLRSARSESCGARGRIMMNLGRRLCIEVRPMCLYPFEIYREYIFRVLVRCSLAIVIDVLEI
jgi:hypothetical protein